MWYFLYCLPTIKIVALLKLLQLPATGVICFMVMLQTPQYEKSQFFNCLLRILLLEHTIPLKLHVLFGRIRKKS